MNGWAHQQKVLVGGCVPNGVVCPKPRRVTVRFSNNQAEGCDSRVGIELLDGILTKVPASPPFFSGSPPNRASNPIIRDEQFWNHRSSPISPMLESPSCAHKNGGSVRVNFRPNLAPVRIEGFNCRGNSSSISANA